MHSPRKVKTAQLTNKFPAFIESKGYDSTEKSVAVDHILSQMHRQHTHTI